MTSPGLSVGNEPFSAVFQIGANFETFVIWVSAPPLPPLIQLHGRIHQMLLIIDVWISSIPLPIIRQSQRCNIGWWIYENGARLAGSCYFIRADVLIAASGLYNWKRQPWYANSHFPASATTATFHLANYSLIHFLKKNSFHIKSIQLKYNTSSIQLQTANSQFFFHLPKFQTL